MPQPSLHHAQVFSSSAVHRRTARSEEYPAGQKARAFYVGRLGLTELPRLTEGMGRPGLWFAAGEGQVHLEVDQL